MKVFTKVFPKYLEIELTNECQSNCPMCPRDKLPNIGFMSDDTFEKITEEIRKSGLILSVFISGMGEPFLHPNILKYIKKLKSLKLQQIVISTNAEKLTPDIFDKLKLLLTPRDIIRINLQAVDITLYGSLMSGLKFKKVMENIDYIIKNKSNLNIGIISITHNMNREHLPKIREFFMAKNIFFDAKPAFARCGNLVNENIIKPIEKFIDVMPICSLFENINFVDWQGNIYCCWNDVKRENLIGSIQKDTFYDIATRKSILLKKGLDYKICQMCDDFTRYS